MKVTRRKLAHLLAATTAGAAVSSEFVLSQAPPRPAGPEAELEAQRTVRAAGQRLASVPLPMATEPAFHFKA